MGVKFKPRSIEQARKFMEKHMVYYDRGIIVSNKPTDMTCQMGYSTSAKYMNFNILCKGIQQHLNLLKPPYYVHSLNKNTTGALILSRNQEWARNLSRLFLNQKVGKTYLAVVYGRENQFPASSGVIENCLSEVKGHVQLDPLGTATKTEWELLGSSSKLPLSLMRLKLRTNHKNQLRFHLANCLQAPVVGDELYKVPELNDLVRHTITLPRKLMYLHCHELSFERWTKFGCIPRSNYMQTFRVAVPMKFRELCRDAQIPIDEMFLKEGAMLVDGVPWTTPDHLHHEEEKYWISPKLLPNSHELPDEEND